MFDGEAMSTWFRTLTSWSVAAWRSRVPASSRRVAWSSTAGRPGDVLVVLAGVVVAVAGVVALTRTEVDGGWYRPVEQVAGFDHTQPLGVIEVGVGVALVLLGLSGMRVIAALLCMAGAATAAVAAVDPGLVDRELALERSWAIILAAGGVAVAILSVLSWQAMIADGRPSPGRRHGYGGLVQQH